MDYSTLFFLTSVVKHVHYLTEEKGKYWDMKKIEITL